MMVQSTFSPHNAGIVLLYCLLQVSIWWLFHTSALLWKVKFPFHARSFQKSGKVKYIHITCVWIGILIPLIPVIANMVGFAHEVQSNPDLQERNVTFASGGLGFVIIRFPPVLCYGYNGSLTFYASVLPIIIVLFIGLTELVFLLALIHKVSFNRSYYSTGLDQGL